MQCGVSAGTTLFTIAQSAVSRNAQPQERNSLSRARGSWLVSWPPFSRKCGKQERHVRLCTAIFFAYAHTSNRAWIKWPRGLSSN